ncbi:hypothetical protein ACFV2Q_23130 [Streptomyces sp. NPDC059650]|uniref:hypothetical protein n=1 Tax=Streptomyces sp. NPDC059650 TaxID=3346896 RepID=UPI003677D872
MSARLPLADAAYALGLSRTAEDTHGLRQRLATAEARNREAVLHLLMNGHTAVARQIAGALLPALPEHVRVGRRSAVALDVLRRSDDAARRTRRPSARTPQPPVRYGRESAGMFSA